MGLIYQRDMNVFICKSFIPVFTQEIWYSWTFYKFRKNILGYICGSVPCEGNVMLYHVLMLWDHPNGTSVWSMCEHSCWVQMGLAKPCWSLMSSPSPNYRTWWICGVCCHTNIWCKCYEWCYTPSGMSPGIQRWSHSTHLVGLGDGICSSLREGNMITPVTTKADEA